MKRLSLFLKAATMAALALGAMSPWLATAATGPWSWHDITDQLTEKNNRPIWAVAHSNDGWFYTDGQNLWNSGQVYRYDGSTQVNITNDVRNAGIDRVDDIVSDNGSTVLFLQDIVRLDNNLRVIAYRNGSYVNITGNIRTVLNSDEGVSKINGRNGTWYIVTTKGRLFRFDANGANGTQITLPDAIRNHLNYSASALLYNVNNGSPASGTERVVFDIVPVTSNNWLAVVDSSEGSVAFYRFDGSTFTDITTTIGTGIERVLKIASNGTSALISMRNGDGDRFNQNRVTDGSTARDVTIIVSASRYYEGPESLTDAVIGWNGTSWMIVNGKRLYRLADVYPLSGKADYYGHTNDLILAIAGDANNRFVLGGAASDSTYNTTDPSYPLTARLVKVIEDGGTSEGTTSNNTTVTTGGTFGGNRVFTSANGPTVTIQGNPSGFRVKNGGEFAYRATATDTNGVDRIDLYVNDARIQTCKASTCEYRTTYYLKTASTRTVKFWVRATDANGNSTDTSGNPDYLTIDANSNATADGSITNTSTNSTQANTGNGISAWDWLEPNASSFNGGETITYFVGAWDADGISQIQIIANGSVKQTCTLNNATGNTQCSAALYANDYGANTNVFVNAKVVDANGNVLWTTGKNVYRNSTVGTSTNTGTSNATISEYFTPDVTSFGTNDSVTYRVNAQDNDGISRIDLYANDAIRKTCDLGNVTGNIQCETALYANDYSANANVFVKTKVTDVYGNITWSSGRTIYRNGTTSTGTNNTSVYDELNPNVSTLNANETTTYRVNAQDADGVNRIDVYANGSVKQSCTFGNSTGNTQCSAVIYANDYSANSTINVNAKVTDANGNTAWTNGKNITRNSSTGTGSTNATVSDTIVSGITSFGPNESATYRVDAQDNDGISQIQIIANGSVKQTCDLNNATGNVQCSAALYANDYSVNTNVFVNAKITDRYGNVVWTNGKNITRNGSSNGSNNTSNAETKRAVIISLESANLKNGIPFYINAQDNNGISKIEAFVNGNLRKTCYPNGTAVMTSCRYYVTQNDFSANSSFTSTIKVTDGHENAAWTTVMHNVGAWNQNGTNEIIIRKNGSVLTRCTINLSAETGSCQTDREMANLDTTSNFEVSMNASGQNGSNGTSNEMSSWDWLEPGANWLEPGVASISQTSRITYHVGAWASVGIKEVTIYANGNAQPACTFSYGTGNVECAKEILGSSFAVNTWVVMNARIRNMNDREIWTTGQSFKITASGASYNGSQTNPNVNSNGTVTASTNMASYGNSDAITISANGSDPDGVERIELYMNGQKLKTCYGTTCSASTNRYSLLPSNAFYASVFDIYGSYVVSPMQTIRHR